MTKHLESEESDLPALAEAGEYNFRPAPGMSRRRLQLIDLMVDEGLSAGDAADRLKMSWRNMRYCFNDGTFRTELARANRALREGLRPKAFRKLDHILDHGGSEKVVADVAKFLAAEDSKPFQVQVNVDVGLSAGYFMKPSDAVQRMLEQAGSSASIFGPVDPDDDLSGHIDLGQECENE